MTPTVRLTLSARPENVALVRELIAAVAEVVETGRSRDDIRAAVSEAANNVVVHAYHGEEEGPLEVTVRMLQAALEVSVRDQGSGIASRESAEAAASESMAERGPGHGLGIAVMDALADRFELRPREPHGVEAVLRFALSAQWRIDGAAEELRGGAFEPVRRDQVAVAMSPAELGSVVLPGSFVRPRRGPASPWIVCPMPSCLPTPWLHTWYPPCAAPCCARVSISVGASLQSRLARSTLVAGGRSSPTRT